MSAIGLSGLVLKRLASGLVTLFIVTLIVFGGTELLPTDVAEAILGQHATPETVAALREKLNLNRPAYERYFEWLINFLRGDLGQSLSSGREISELIDGRLQNSLFLAATAAIIAIPLAVGLGLLAALYEGRAADKGLTASTL